MRPARVHACSPDLRFARSRAELASPWVRRVEKANASMRFRVATRVKYPNRYTSNNQKHFWPEK
jgi:hypothetical protein